MDARSKATSSHQETAGWKEIEEKAGLLLFLSLGDLGWRVSLGTAAIEELCGDASKTAKQASPVGAAL